jgi:hypothetical protein
LIRGNLRNGDEDRNSNGTDANISAEGGEELNEHWVGKVKDIEMKDQDDDEDETLKLPKREGSLRKAYNDMLRTDHLITIIEAFIRKPGF